MTLQLKAYAPAIHEDLGLCYVDRLVINGVEIFAITPANPEPTIEQRQMKVDAAVEQHGYTIDYTSVHGDH